MNFNEIFIVQSFPQLCVADNCVGITMIVCIWIISYNFFIFQYVDFLENVNKK